MIDYDTELQLHNEQLRGAYNLTATDRILDIGCGTGQTTRETARLAPDGMAVGVDIDEAMVARARESERGVWFDSRAWIVRARRL